VPVHPVIAQRWSPRAFRDDTTLAESQLRALFEAARWAPSSGNTQPARFLVGLRGDQTFTKIFDTLAPGNQTWAGNAAALIVGLVVTENEKGPIPVAEYGLGLAVANLTLQAVSEGLMAHQMGGFDRAALAESFNLPDTVHPVVAITVGHQAHPRILNEALAARELVPRTRLELSEIVFGAGYGEPLFTTDPDGE